MKNIRILLLMIMVVFVIDTVYSAEVSIADKVRAFWGRNKQDASLASLQEKTPDTNITKSSCVDLNNLPVSETKPFFLNENETVSDAIQKTNVTNNNNFNNSYPNFSSKTNNARSYTYSPSSDSGSTWVNGYTRKDGKYVQGHYKTRSNHTVYDNWTTKGNTNPHTGKKGYKFSPQKRSSTRSYSRRSTGKRK